MLCDELLNGEMFCTVAEAQVLIERWSEHYPAFARTVPSATARVTGIRWLADEMLKQSRAMDGVTVVDITCVLSGSNDSLDPELSDDGVHANLKGARVVWRLLSLTT